MKKIAFLTVILIFCYLSVSSQSCLPEGIEFTTQSQIDGFQILHPNCTEIEGFVYISGNDITNLDGLSVITSIGGNLELVGNENLFSLTGLHSLTSIGGNLTFWGNYGLSCFTGLDSVASIGGVISIIYNPPLTSLSGLGNIDTASIFGLLIQENYSLSNCEVQSVCDYLAGPDAWVEIYLNHQGCNSPEEVQDSCEANAVYVDEQYIKNNLMLYPNPANQELNISARGYHIDEVSIYTLTGQQILKARPDNGILDISHLQSGMYIVEVTVDNTMIRQKLLVQR